MNFKLIREVTLLTVRPQVGKFWRDYRIRLWAGIFKHMKIPYSRVNGGGGIKICNIVLWDGNRLELDRCEG